MIPAPPAKCIKCPTLLRRIRSRLTAIACPVIHNDNGKRTAGSTRPALLYCLCTSVVIYATNGITGFTRQPHGSTRKVYSSINICPDQKVKKLLYLLPGDRFTALQFYRTKKYKELSVIISKVLLRLNPEVTKI